MATQSASNDLTALAMNAAAGPVGGLSLSELHGAVIGIAVADYEAFSLHELVQLLGADALSSEDDVVPFVRESLDQLMAEDLSFMPLLPDDDESMSDQLEGLASWTASFLAGMVAGLSVDERTLAALPEEAQEIIRDFSAIAQLDVAADDDDEPDYEDESDLLELQEFVKVGTLLIMNVLNDVSDDTP
jgi:uncharacterized protein YgfB (UPF0149 family)